MPLGFSKKKNYFSAAPSHWHLTRAETHAPENRTRNQVGGSAARRSRSAERAPLHEAPAQSAPFLLNSGEAQGEELSGDQLTLCAFDSRMWLWSVNLCASQKRTRSSEKKRFFLTTSCTSQMHARLAFFENPQTRIVRTSVGSIILQKSGKLAELVPPAHAQ